MSLSGQKVQKPRSELDDWFRRFKVPLAILLIALSVGGGIIWFIYNQGPGPVTPTNPSFPFNVDPSSQTLTLYSGQTTVTFWNVTSSVLVQGVFNLTISPGTIEGSPLNVTVTAWSGWINPSPTMRTSTGKVLAYLPQTLTVTVTLGDTPCYVVRIGLVPNCIESGNFVLTPAWRSA